MAKRLCKMNRKQIADSLGDIHRLVVEPKFVCRSCARSSAEKGSLCKPAAIPPKQCQSKPIEQQKACGLLAEALPNHDEARAEKVRSVVEKVKQRAAQENKSKVAEMSPNQQFDLSDKHSIKRAKKALKKQVKAQKKLIKLAQKQLKLAKKQRRLELLASQRSVVTLPEKVPESANGNLH